MSASDKERVQLLLAHAVELELPNLRTWCRVWLDPASAFGRGLAEEKIRQWVEQGDPSKDARL